MSDGESRQYIREAWQPYTLTSENEEILCNLNPDSGREGEATLCLVPTQAKNVVADPASLREKPNVMSQWLDRLTAAGAAILLMHGEYYDDLQLLSERAARGVDGFRLMEIRIRAVIDDALAKGYTQPGRVVVMGSSRHGFAILHAMALNPDVSAAVAHQPVIHWPRMSEFTGMDDNEIIERNGLLSANRSASHCARSSSRRGTPTNESGRSGLSSLTDALRDRHMRASRTPCKQLHTRHDAQYPGHDGTRVPESALDAVVPWLWEQGLL